MLTHPKSTVRILHMLRHMSLDHVTLLRGEFQPSKFFPNRTYGGKQTNFALGFASNFYFIYYELYLIVSVT